jgi:hypothetical protein
MNRIIRDNYPIEKLPEDLRQLVDPTKAVRIVVEQADSDEPSDSLTRFAGRFADRNVSAEEAVARIRALRDEWDD